jgi:hypothetical protein
LFGELIRLFLQAYPGRFSMDLCEIVMVWLKCFTICEW